MGRIGEESSGVGTVRASPYTAEVERNTISRMPAASIECRRRDVTRTFCSKCTNGSVAPRRTSGLAAAWTTLWHPCRSPGRSAVRRSCSCSLAFPAAMAAFRKDRRPELRLSTTTENRPSAARASTRWLPMKPAPPVTRTASLLILRPPAEVDPEDDGDEDDEQDDAQDLRDAEALPPRDQLLEFRQRDQGRHDPERDGAQRRSGGHRREDLPRLDAEETSEDAPDEPAAHLHRERDVGDQRRQRDL